MSRNPGNLRLKAAHECTGRQAKNLINNRVTRYVGSNTHVITQAARKESRQQRKHKQQQQQQPANQ